MNDAIRQAALGGLAEAARAFAARVGAQPPTAPLAAEAQAALDTAAALLGRRPDGGLQTAASPFGHLDGRPLTAALDDPAAAARGVWQGACPRGDFGAETPQEKLKQTASAFLPPLQEAVRRGDYAAAERLCADTLAFFPAFAGDAEDGDISLYDYGHLLAALASCLAAGAPQDADAQGLLLFSCDFSGIQKYIYLIRTKAALRTLRSRSFFLELLMEHLIDELLESCGLTRANLVYAGGGHAYVLLPNTEAAAQAAARFARGANAWLGQQFGIALYLACGTQPCSPSALLGHAGQEAYSDIFRSLSAKIGHVKLFRYDVSALRRLNAAAPAGRECTICGRSAENTSAPDEDALCLWCSRLQELGGRLTDRDVVFAVLRAPRTSCLCLPLPCAVQEERRLCLLTAHQAAALIGDASLVRLYSKNAMPPALTGCTRLDMGDHCPEKELARLTESGAGIRRMGVLRADVDNLGARFIAGFTGGPGGKSYVSLMRAAAFSRCMSQFFKRFINAILAELPCADGVLVVYSGGDDLFLVGGWQPLLQAALALQDAFARYTGGALTFSAGFGLYDDGYPLARAAEEVAELEDFAKTLPGKNAVTLFAPDEGLRFAWPVFRQRVMVEKYDLLDRFFGGAGGDDRGSAFLYRLLSYLRTADDRLNLARCAYLLARLKPDDHAPRERKDAYAAFAKQFSLWAFDPEARRELIAAIYLYVYLHRDTAQEERSAS